jgi:hypothetical protein
MPEARERSHAAAKELVPRQATFAAIQAAKRLRLAANGVATGAEGDAHTLLGGAISVATVPPGALAPCGLAKLAFHSPERHHVTCQSTDRHI